LQVPYIQGDKRKRNFRKEVREMTKEQLIEKFEDMLPNIEEYLRDEVIRLFDSGALDTEKWENNFLLPKLILTVALENCAHEYRPPHSFGKKDVANLRHF